MIIIIIIIGSQCSSFFLGSHLGPCFPVFLRSCQGPTRVPVFWFSQGLSRVPVFWFSQGPARVPGPGFPVCHVFHAQKSSEEHIKHSFLFSRNRIGLLTPFAKINKREGLNKQPPHLSQSFTRGKRNIFSSLKSKKTRWDQE